MSMCCTPRGPRSQVLSATESEATIDFCLTPLRHWFDACCSPATGSFSGPRILYHKGVQPDFTHISVIMILCLRSHPRLPLVTLCFSFQSSPDSFTCPSSNPFLSLSSFFLHCDHKHVKNNMLGFHNTLQVPELWFWEDMDGSLLSGEKF